MKFQFKYYSDYKKGQHRPMSRYKVAFYLKGSTTPVTQYHTNSLWQAIKWVPKGWLYAFKYPTTVSKTFWQVLTNKLSF